MSKRKPVKPEPLSQQLAQLLVQAAQQETQQQHGEDVYLAVTAYHVTFNKRTYIVQISER
jgi:hypothetical protein